jgi:hypothetical protein
MEGTLCFELLDSLYAYKINLQVNNPVKAYLDSALDYIDNQFLFKGLRIVHWGFIKA